MASCGDGYTAAAHSKPFRSGLAPDLPSRCCIALGAICFGKVLKQLAGAIRYRRGAAESCGLLSLLCPACVSSVVFAALGAMFLYFWLKGERLSRPPLHMSHYLLAAVFTAYFLLYFFNAMAPEAKSGWLDLPFGAGSALSARTWVPARSRGISTPVFPRAWRCCSWLPLRLGNTRRRRWSTSPFLWHWLGKWFSTRAAQVFQSLGICAAVLMFASPLAGKDATSAYNDAALACVAFTLFSLLQAWDEERSR